MTQPKVLIAAPQNEVKNYCFDEWLCNVNSFSYKNKEVFLADNSQTRDNYLMIKRMGVEAKYVNPKNKVSMSFIADSHELCRQRALEINADYLLHLETDIFPPISIIEDLLMHKKDVVSAMYHINFGEESHLMLQRVEEIGEMERDAMNIEVGDMLFANGHLRSIYACGMGCILISREVLEKIHFRWKKGTNAHPDSFFAYDLHKLGIKQYIDTSILCEHRNSQWVNF